MATRTDLGKWIITNGGDYDASKTYEERTMVMYENSTYLTLKTVTGITPVDDKVNYTLMARGFNPTALGSVTAKDTSGALGTVGATVSAQSLVDWIADQAMDKLIKKAAMSNQQVNDVNKVPTSALAYTMQQAITQLNGDLNHVTFYRDPNYLQADFTLGDKGYKLQFFPGNNGIKLFDSSWKAIWQTALTDNTIKKSGTYANDKSTSEIYASMNNDTMLNFVASGGTTAAAEIGIDISYGGAEFLLFKGNSWRGFGLAGSLNSKLFFGKLTTENTLKWIPITLWSDFDAIYTTADSASDVVNLIPDRPLNILNIYGGTNLFGKSGNYIGEIFISKGCITGIMVDHWTGNLYTVKGATYGEKNIEFIPISK